MRKLIVLAAAALVTTSLAAPSYAAHHEEAPAVHPALAQALASDVRNDDKARDDARHPAETLTFFDVKPGMTVVDFMPSSGWYSRVLIPYLGDDGTYIGLNPAIPENGPGFFQSMRNYADTLPGQSSEWVGDSGASVVGGNIGEFPEELNGTADRFLIFREIHNIRRFNWFHDVATAARTLLKDDGLLGVVQHRAPANSLSADVLGNRGYQREQDVIALFSAYGFELVARSDINANPKDPADWEGGVWSLPPVYGGAPEGSEERARRAEIGESDRMTLLFRKRP
jgi:predicted methyltransferase